MELTILDQKGKKKEALNVSDDVFKVEVKPAVISQYVQSYLSNQREANAHSKVRSEVSGGGKKPHRQKGTGRARSGSSRNPIWTGGGITFGPRSNRNWKKGLNKKFKHAALKNVLSSLVATDKLLVVDDITLKGEEQLTKQATAIHNALTKGEKMTIVTNENDDIVQSAFSNIAKVRVVSSTELNTYDLFTGGVVVLEKDVVPFIEAKFKK